MAVFVFNILPCARVSRTDVFLAFRRLRWEHGPVTLCASPKTEGFTVKSLCIFLYSQNILTVRPKNDTINANSLKTEIEARCSSVSFDFCRAAVKAERVYRRSRGGLPGPPWLDRRIRSSGLSQNICEALSMATRSQGRDSLFHGPLAKAVYFCST